MGEKQRRLEDSAVSPERSRGKDEYAAVLRQVVNGRRPDLLPLVDSMTRRQLTEAEREELRQTIADELTATGLGPGDEPNDRGLVLESVIDWLGRR